MNLLTDNWIPVHRENSDAACVALTDLADLKNPPLRLAWPRPDFRAACMELIIGILAVALRPKNRDEWLDLNAVPPSPHQIGLKLAPLVPVFEVEADGPCFMQDFDPGLRSAKDSIHHPRTLLMDAPGEITLTKNTDWFVRRASSDAVMSLRAAAMALYTLQTYAPSGGVGRRTGFRGGGPLTTVVVPADRATLLEIALANIPIGEPVMPKDLPRIFPWLAPTKCSNKTDASLSLSDVHPLQAYFGMPRRIRLDVEPGNGRRCFITGEVASRVVVGVRQASYGLNYGPLPLLHPLSPYYTSKSAQTMLPVHCKATGVGWNDYLGLIANNENNGQVPAAAVNLYREMAVAASGSARLRATGYACDNAKTEIFVEGEVPIPIIRDEASRVAFDRRVTALIEACGLTVGRVRAAIWNVRAPNERSIDTVRTVIANVEREFWARLQDDFLKALAVLTKHHQRSNVTALEPSDWAQTWPALLTRTAFSLYDESIPINPRTTHLVKGGDGEIVPRSIEQRRRLGGFLSGRSKAGEAFVSKFDACCL